MKMNMLEQRYLLQKEKILAQEAFVHEIRDT